MEVSDNCSLARIFTPQQQLPAAAFDALGVYNFGC